MRKLSTALLCSVLGLVGILQIHGQTVPPKQTELRVYVGPIEGTDKALADMLTAKIISHLVKHGITVVESEDDADAVLKESGVVQSSNDQYGQNHYRIQGGVRLVNRDGKIIWADDINSGKFSESASTGFAENVAKCVAKALNAKQVPK